MIYFSDHGDDADKGYSHEASKFTYPMSHIPFFMIFSPAYMQERGETINELKNHSQSYWTNDLIYNVMVDIMGVENVPGISPSLDLASGSYGMTKDSIRTLHGKKRIEE